MDTAEIVKKLGSLVKLDLDAIESYDQAIEKIKEDAIRTKLSEFRDDHQRHVNHLSETITKFGEDPPKRKPDLKGYLLEGFTALRSITGTEGALKAMKTNEELTNKKYDEARSLDLPPDQRDLVESHYKDEVRHLSYINDVLRNRLWEK
jgi:uncharacterized protein (TIGR02284 family)